MCGQVGRDEADIASGDGHPDRDSTLIAPQAVESGPQKGGFDVTSPGQQVPLYEDRDHDPLQLRGLELDIVDVPECPLHEINPLIFHHEVGQPDCYLLPGKDEHVREGGIAIQSQGLVEILFRIPASHIPREPVHPELFESKKQDDKRVAVK